MRWALIDSNVYIDHWERGLHASLLDRVRQAFIVRHSSVVLSELRRGARTFPARRRVEDLRRIAVEVWAPPDEDWWEAGRLVQSIGDANGWETAKRREFQNDALIALTTRRHGATLVTENVADFRLLLQKIRFGALFP